MRTRSSIRPDMAVVPPRVRYQNARSRSADRVCVAVTTTVRPATELAVFIGGFVAAEGCFTRVVPRKFVFSVGLGAIDTSTCELIHAFLGVGQVRRYPRRQPHYDDEVTFTVGSLVDHVQVVIPFMDEHLPASHKRIQFLACARGAPDL